MKEKNKKSFLCHAIGNRGLIHAWGRGSTVEEAESQCRLAVKESIADSRFKLRHAPYTYETKEEK